MRDLAPSCALTITPRGIINFFYITVLLIPALVGLYIYYFYSIYASRYPSGPRPPPIIGNLSDMIYKLSEIGDLYSYMGQCAKRYGAVYTLFLRQLNVRLGDYAMHLSMRH